MQRKKFAFGFLQPIGDLQSVGLFNWARNRCSFRQTVQCGLHLLTQNLLAFLQAQHQIDPVVQAALVTEQTIEFDALEFDDGRELASRKTIYRRVGHEFGLSRGLAGYS